MDDLIPADVRSRLRTLQLTTRRAAGGQGIGAHASRSRGGGHEFAQYRAYEPGDEPRAIDWKLYARSDRAFVREAERDSPLALWLVIDASASMGQADAGAPEWSRLAAAKGLAACLAELALAEGDRFGWIVLEGGWRRAGGGSGRTAAARPAAPSNSPGWPQPADLPAADRPRPALGTYRATRSRRHA